ncbi:MAG: ABC transporter substrate-binding protein [Clostridiales bacterium]|jgi:putative ABC transport system substrate-binding protein|nr:ABC transporter substrate-binding protein [Clostridiales bacterium]
MKKEQILTRLIACAAALCLLSTGCSGDPASGSNKTIKIGILQIVDHVALDASRQGFIDELANQGYVDGQNIQIDYQNAQGDQSNLKAMSQKLVSDKSDLILAIATPSGQSVAAETQDIPIVITAVTDPKDAGLVNSNEKPGTNVTGTSDMTPVALQLDLMLEVLPDVKTVGIMYNSGEVNSKIQGDLAVEKAAALGLQYEVATVTSTNDVAQVAESIASRVDVIYVPTDNVIASSMPLLTKITDEHSVPVIAGEEGMLEGGGLITVGINYYSLGLMTGEMAVKILKGESQPQDMPIQYLDTSSIVVNKVVADRLGITIPQNILDSAERIIE